MCYKVSLLVAMYNAERFISRCLESLLGQDYSNLEIIVVDDGSTDDSLKIVNSFEDKRIVVITTENFGLAHARNVGIAKCSGDYFCFIDADDYVEVNYVSMLVDGIKRYNCECCFCGIKRDCGDKLLDIDYGQDNRLIVDKRNPINHGIMSLNSGIYKANIFKNVMFDERCPLYGEDYIYKVKVVLNCDNIYCLKGTPYIYKDDNSLSITKDQSEGKWGAKAYYLIKSKMIVLDMFLENKKVCRQLASQALRTLVAYSANSRKWNIVFDDNYYTNCIREIDIVKRYLSPFYRFVFYMQRYFSGLLMKVYFVFSKKHE